MENVTITAARVRPECSLFAYRVTEERFDDIALATYFASGKFDKASMHRWSAGKLLTNPHKSQHVRASIDNAVMLLPIGSPPRRPGPGLPMKGHAILIGFHTRDTRFVPVAFGIISDDPFSLEYASSSHVIPVHIITTWCGKQMDFETVCESCAGIRPDVSWASSPSLPRDMHMLVSDLPDAVFEAEGVTYDSVYNEYARQHIIAAGLVCALEHAKKCTTPSPTLDRERLERLDAFMNHVRCSRREDLQLPPTRRIVGRLKSQQLEGVMTTYLKYSNMFGRLI
jgi:hypothetical protein